MLTRSGFVGCVFMLLLGTSAGVCQEGPEMARLGDNMAPIFLRVGDAFVFQTEGPELRRFADGDTRTHQWFVVQDSSLGVVFREPSGLKRTGASGDGEGFDGDIDVVTIRAVDAVEFGVMTFNVWDEYTGIQFFTHIESMGARKEFDMDPRFKPCVRDEAALDGYRCYTPYRHLTSIIYVSRVRYSDDSIVIADVEPARRAAAAFGSEISVEDLTPDENTRVPEYLDKRGT